jgi:hypothetical protein
MRYPNYNKKSGSEFSYSYTYRFSPSDVVSDPAEFTLEYYKIQTPTDEVYEDGPGFNWLLWGGIGVGCIALSVVLAWFIRRKRQAS